MSGGYTIDNDSPNNPYKDEQYDRIIENLKKQCKIYYNPTSEEEENAELLGRFNNANLGVLGNKYKEEVRNGNNYIQNLLNLEEEFFKEKYGEDIYNYLKLKRQDYFNKELSSGGGGGEGSDFSENAELYTKLHSNDFFKNYKKIKGEINNKINKLKNETEINTRIVEYRNEMFYDIALTNRYLTTIYYILVFVLFIFLLFKNQLTFTKKRIILYLILLLFPILIFPLFWKFTIYIISLFQDNIKESGPKNAFLNTVNDNN